MEFGAGHAGRVRRASHAALVGMALVAPLPVLGPVLDAAATLSLLAATRDGRGGRWAGAAVNAAVLIALLAMLAAWAAVIRWFAGARGTGDESIAAAVVAGAVVAWTLRHAAVCWHVKGTRAAAVSDARGGLVLSALLAPTLSLGLVLLVGVGVLVSHVALFPPFCLLFPLWLGGAVVWVGVTITAFLRLSRGKSA